MRKLTILTLAVLLVGSLFAVAAVADGYDGERANLEVEQPVYIDSDVDVERTDNATIYHVRGPEHTIEFGNANYSNVTDYGVLDGPGSLEANDELETFEFDANEAEATTAVYFDVEQDGEQTRYVADIRVSDVKWAHVPADEYAEQQDELAAWEQLQREAQNAVPGQDPVETIQSGLRYEAFFESPTAALRQDMQGTLIMLVMTPGGLIIGGTFVGVAVLMLAKAYRYRNRMQKQLADLESIDREMDEAWLQKARQILQQVDLNELFPDHLARALRDYFGRNTWLAFKQYELLRSSVSVKGTMLQMMAQTGYVASVERDDTGHVTKANAVREDAVDEGSETVDLSSLEYEDEDDRAIIDAIPSDDLDEDVFEADIDVSKVSFPIDNRDVSDSDLVAELNPSFPGDFEDREELARVLAKLMGFVADHPHTDDDGITRREKDLLSFLMEMDTILHEEADFPPAYIHQKELLYVAEHMDKGEQLNDRIEALELDGVSSGPSAAITGGD
ncbi:hypothetical protein ACLI4U_19035 (plasmid) [Natrialbaceae archaeon A-CW2]